MLNTGPDDHRNPTDMAEFEDVLRDCARHRLPMICANPDLQVIRGGVRVLCAGSLALRYQELAATSARSASLIRRSTSRCWNASACRSSACWRWATRCTPTSPARRASDIAACWVLGGIHGEALVDGAGGYDLAKAEAVARLEGVAPVATIPRFAW